jgi:hypothetical protein
MTLQRTENYLLFSFRQVNPKADGVGSLSNRRLTRFQRKIKLAAMLGLTRDGGMFPREAKTIPEKL